MKNLLIMLFLPALTSLVLAAQLDPVPDDRSFNVRNFSAVGDGITNNTIAVQGLSLTNITGTAAKGMRLHHIRDLVLKNIDVTGYEGDFITTEDVTGEEF